MGHRGMQEQLEQLPDEVDRLKSNLDQTLQTFEDLSAKTSDLAHEAREVVSVFGEESGGPSAAWGMIFLLAISAGAIWLISPETFRSIRDFLTAQYESVTGTAREETQS